jgi:hypothetical protein
MNTCPHCDSPLDDGASRCARCGKSYWQADLALPADETEEAIDEEMQGCFPVLFWPLALSVLVTAFMIFIGFVIHILSRLTDIRLKALWIFCSLAAGGAVYLFVSRFKRKKS